MTGHELVDPAFSGRLCLTLLHSVWQVALLALVAWCVDWLLRGRSVERCYAVHVVALMVGLAAMPVTYAMIDVPIAPPMLVTVDESGVLADASATISVATSDDTTTAPLDVPFDDPLETRAIDLRLELHVQAPAPASEASAAPTTADSPATQSSEKAPSWWL